MIITLLNVLLSIFLFIQQVIIFDGFVHIISHFAHRILCIQETVYAGLRLSYALLVGFGENQGEGDADTVAAVAGSLAGLYYGYDSIPHEWLAGLKNKEMIVRVCG